MNFVTFGNFVTQLGIVYSSHASMTLGKDHWIVKKEFRYYVDGDKNKVVIVPRGFLTDGASVPRLFWGIIPPWGKYGQAVVLHDYLCEIGGYWNYGVWETIQRKDADLIFKSALEELGVKSPTRWLMYAAVSLYTKLAKFRKTNTRHKTKRVLEEELRQVYEQTKLWI